MNDPKGAAAYHPGDGHVTRPDLDALREQFAEAAYRAEKTHDFGESWTEEFADESDSYKATYYAIADALLGILPAALAAGRARADQVASEAVHEYALALEQNPSAENWRWSDFVWDAHQWADSKSAAPTAEQ